MDLYTLDENFQQKTAIDEAVSIIWTERYASYGDFNLVIPDDPALKATLVEGTFLWTPDSKEAMIVDTISTEAGLCTLTGPALSGFLLQRILRDSWTADKDSWQLTGAAGAIAAQIVSDMCIAGGLMDGSGILLLGANEIIPNLSLGAQASGTSISVAVGYGNVYDGVKSVCALDTVGFAIYLNMGVGSYELKFETYRGLDRTTDQSDNAIVIFEPALDSLAEVKQLRSTAGYKNVAIVWPNGITAQNQMGIAYAPGSSGLIGFDRRTLMISASDVNAADYSTPDLVAILNQKAKDALANNNFVRMTDGQIVPQGSFKYGVDYSLGDILELRANDGVSQAARVTEYIRSKNSSGSAEYPTLSVID